MSTLDVTGAAVSPLDSGPRLVVDGLSRSFGETKALSAATLTIQPGEIHSLAGENGSGKSTLIKVLSGVIHPDGGQLLWEGRPTRLANPSAAQALGISTVFQETLVTLEMSVKDNIFFGTDGLFRYAHRRSDERGAAEAALDSLGLPRFNVDRPMWTLSLAERQLVTIARAIVRPWQVLILDEGTSALDSHQRDRLFGYLRSSRLEGKSVLFTSHRMDEVFDLADRITVLRTGGTVAELSVADCNEREVLNHMSGRERIAQALDASAAPARVRGAKSGKLVVRVDDLVLRPQTKAISLEVRSGEILGLAGLEGQGQVEFVESVCGLRRPISGQVIALEEDQHERTVRSYGDANHHGIRYVPRDRRTEGLFGPLSVFDNFAMALWENLNRFGILQRRQARNQYREFATSSRLVARSSRQAISTLSGGNQQKILLGRWVAMNPKVLVLNDPLRGVDANTKDELYEFFRGLADGGMAIIFLSTEILELLTLADQIAVFHEGGLEALLPAESTTDTDIVAAMFGEDPERGEGD